MCLKERILPAGEYAAAFLMQSPGRVFATRLLRLNILYTFVGRRLASARKRGSGLSSLPSRSQIRARRNSASSQLPVIQIFAPC